MGKLNKVHADKKESIKSSKDTLLALIAKC